MHETTTVTKIEVVRTRAMRLTDTFIVRSSGTNDGNSDAPGMLTGASGCQSSAGEAGALLPAGPAAAGINSP
jgi:hypothetical protein